MLASSSFARAAPGSIPSPSPPWIPDFSFKAARQPMLWAAVAYSSGIVAGVYQWRPALWWIAAAISFVAAASYFALRRSVFGWTLALAALFLAGAFHVQMRDASTHLDAAIQPYANKQEIQITAHVIRDGRMLKNALGEIRQSLDIEAEQIQNEAGQTLPIHSGIRLSIYSPHSSSAEGLSAQPVPVQIFHYGDRLRLHAKLRMPRNFRNPGAFDYQRYLADHGISALGSAKVEDLELLPGFAGNRVAAWRSRLHRGIVAKVHELWPPQEAALIDAMVIGEEAFIDRDTRVDFQRAGTYHVLVVSGMNVSILAFVVFWTLRRLRLNEVMATLLTVSCCVGYAFITEVGARCGAPRSCAPYISAYAFFIEAVP